MEQINFIDPDTKEQIPFYVIEQTQVNGTRYLLVAEEEEQDCDAYIMREVAAEHDEVLYEMVEDESELIAVGKLFAELIEDTDIRF
jgi:predicted  nucleic acid-binding Zn ribbon protein